VIIKNFDELSKTKLRRDALEMMEAGISAILPINIFNKTIGFDFENKVLSIFDNDHSLVGRRLFVIGGGKAGGAMAEALEQIIPPELITAGVVNCNIIDYDTKKIKINLAGHPIPDVRGITGVHEMLVLMDKYKLTEDDIIICLISGGGSALLPYPVDEISFEEKQKTTEQLLKSGAEIAEINIVRKHLSKVKGGNLGRYFAPAKIISLIISDVVGNDLSSIASGPTVSDTSTFESAFEILNKYDLLSNTPENVVDYIKNNIGNEEKETPNTMENVINYIIADNKLALDAMANHATKLGYTPRILTAEQKGEPEIVASSRAAEIIRGDYLDSNVLLLGGETTPRLPLDAENPGIGGRNQHFALASLLGMADFTGEWVFASMATDGMDYMTGVAGTIVDKHSLNMVKVKGLDIGSYLSNYNSYSLLKQIENSIIETGATGTNVGDIMVYILK
jgi:hydroxypyruvate reductase/glycerate 2-kinase